MATYVLFYVGQWKATVQITMFSVTRRERYARMSLDGGTMMGETRSNLCHEGSMR